MYLAGRDSANYATDSRCICQNFVKESSRINNKHWPTVVVEKTRNLYVNSQNGETRSRRSPLALELMTIGGQQ